MSEVLLSVAILIDQKPTSRTDFTLFMLRVIRTIIILHRRQWLSSRCAWSRLRPHECGFAHVLIPVWVNGVGALVGLALRVHTHGPESIVSHTVPLVVFIADKNRLTA